MKVDIIVPNGVHCSFAEVKQVVLKDGKVRVLLITYKDEASFLAGDNAEEAILHTIDADALFGPHLQEMALNRPEQAPASNS